MQIILLVHEHLPLPQQVEDGFIGLALAMLLQDGFANQLSGHLLVNGRDRGHISQFNNLRTSAIRLFSARSRSRLSSYLLLFVATTP